MPAKSKSKKINGEYEELILPNDGEYAILHTATPRLYRNIAIGFLVSVILLTVFAYFFVTTKASIVVIVKPQTLNLSNIFTVAREPVGANSLTGLVLTAEASSTADFAPSSGASEAARAFGTVVIFNKTNRDQPLVATTRLLSPGNVLFRIKKKVVAPAGGQVEVEAAADQPGPAGEIGPTRFTIPGLRPALQESIYAESKSRMIGGEKRISALSEADVTRAKASLSETLFKAGQSKLREMMQAAGGSFDSAELVIDSSDFATSQPVGTVLDKFKVTGRLKAVGVFYNQKDLRQSLLAGLKIGLAQGDRLDQVSPVPAVKLENYDLASGAANLRAEQEVVVKQNIEDLLDKSRIANLTVETATLYFKSYSSVSDVSIKLEPFWLKRIPKDPSKIDISLVNAS